MESEFIDYLNKMAVDSKETEKKLISEERKDEANIERVRSNIIEVFRCLWNASLKEHSNETDEFVKKEQIIKSFLIKSELIPKNWIQSLAQARQYNDASKILIEETKLKTVKEITSYFTTA